MFLFVDDSNLRISRLLAYSPRRQVVVSYLRSLSNHVGLIRNNLAKNFGMIRLSCYCGKNIQDVKNNNILSLSIVLFLKTEL